MRAILGLGFALALTIVGWAQQPTPVRTADAACARCHSKVVHTYLSTPMANASGMAQEKLIPGSFTQATSGTQYRVFTNNGVPVLSIRGGGTESDSAEHPLSYFLGSGHLGVTYLYSIHQYLFESPVAWYAPSNSYDMKPGLETLSQTPPALVIQSNCLRCHMSGVQPVDAGTVNRYTGLPFLHGGITCEGCHGDTQQHVRSGGKVPVDRPASVTAEKRDSVCISCHLEGDVTVDRAGRSILDYKPGDSISDYLAFYVYAGSNLTLRGVSEVEQFAQSHCKRASGDRMSCTTCHDPHYTPPPERRVAFYRSKCLQCHNQPQFVTTHHPENQDCTSCHMRHTGAENIPHVAWTDHRILRLPAPPPEPVQHDADAKLIPIFSPAATDRDLGMAYYQAMLNGDRFAGPKAWAILQKQGAALDQDKAALDAIGNMSAEQGDLSRAETAFTRALQLDPKDLTAISNLAIIEAKQGQLNAAITLLRSAFERNQDVVGLAMNLARLECAAGHVTDARATLNAALAYGSGPGELRQLQTQLGSCGTTPQSGGTQ